MFALDIPLARFLLLDNYILICVYVHHGHSYNVQTSLVRWWRYIARLAGHQTIIGQPLKPKEHKPSCALLSLSFLSLLELAAFSPFLFVRERRLLDRNSRNARPDKYFSSACISIIFHFEVLQTIRADPTQLACITFINCLSTFHSIMPRRPPPTALRLATGPTPTRSRSKHVLPSIPPPTFHPLPVWVSQSSRAPAPRETIQKMTQAELAPLDILSLTGVSGSGSASPVSAGSITAGRRKMIKGPWDHSGSISLEFDVESVLAPLEPVAIPWF